MFTFNVDVLKKSLTQLSNVVKHNNAIPILGYVRITPTATGAKVQGTDHRTYYTIYVPATVEDDSQEILLDASETKSMLSKLDPKDTVSFTSNDVELLITSGTSTWRRMVRTSVDMPTFPELSEDMFQELPSCRLVELLTKAMKATPKKQTFSPGITQLHCDKGCISSGDGLWFQRVSAQELSHVSTTIPLEGVKTLLSILRGDDAPIQFGYNDTHTVVRSENETIGITRLMLEFPDISPYLDNPKISHTDEIITLSRELSTALSQVSLSANPDTGTVTIELDNPSKMKLVANTFEGSAETYVSCQWEGAKRTIHVDWRALKGVISACGNPEKFIIHLGPDARRNPSTLYIEHNGVSAAIVQQRAVR